MIWMKKALFYIIFVELLIIKTSIEIRNEFTHDYVCTKYKSIDVRAAFLLDKYIVLMGDAEKFDGTTDHRVSVRIFRTESPNSIGITDKTNYFEAKRFQVIEDIDKKVDLKYVFSTTSMGPIFDKQYPTDNRTQTMNDMHYFVKSVRATPLESPKLEITAYEIDSYKPNDDTDPTFDILNYRTVYLSNHPNYDETELLNVKLLMLHFPEGVQIKSIVILEENVSTLQKSYLALVYTKETMGKMSLNIRHYLRGIAKTYEMGGTYFDRLVWQFDRSFQNKTGTGACTQMIQLPTAVTLSHTEQIGTNTKSFHILEFYNTEYKKIRVIAGPLNYATLVDDMVNQKRESTKNFFRCGLHNMSVAVPINDCNKNPHFNGPLNPKDALTSFDLSEDSEDFYGIYWLVFAILFGMVALIALVSYEIYSLNLVSKQNN